VRRSGVHESGSSPLLLEQQGLSGDGADAPGAKELREGDQQVDGKDDDITHRANRIITAGTCKTARRARIASHCEFATHNRRLLESIGHVPPAEYEQAYHRLNESQAMAA